MMFDLSDAANKIATYCKSIEGADSCGTAIMTVSPNVATLSVQVLAANPNRRGLIIYNNSANSVYISFDVTASSANHMTAIIPTFAQFTMTKPIYTGVISAIRNAGTGTLLITELTT